MYYTTEIGEQRASQQARQLRSSNQQTQTTAPHKIVSYSNHPSWLSVGTADTTLGVGDATRECIRQSCWAAKRLLGTDTEPCCFSCSQPLEPTVLALGACIESYTEVGGVLAR